MQRGCTPHSQALNLWGPAPPLPPPEEPASFRPRAWGTYSQGRPWRQPGRGLPQQSPSEGHRPSVGGIQNPGIPGIRRFPSPPAASVSQPIKGVIMEPARRVW